MAEDKAEDKALVSSRVWDLPVRVFHWSIVMLVTAAWATAHYDLMIWHKRCGYAILALLLARLAWGVCGSATARFASFVRGPRAVFVYARHFATRDPSHAPGHNPLGAFSVLALLAALLTQSGTGLILSDTDFVNSGPLSSLVGYETSFTADRVHGWCFTAIECLVALHVAVILFYRVRKRENLVWPMITGVKRLPAPPAFPLRFAPAWRALALLALAGGFVWWLAVKAVPPIPG